MLLLTPLTLHLNRSVMPKPVYLLTVQKAHKEYSSLTDQIRAKYEQLEYPSTQLEFGLPGTPTFDPEACELANLLACVSRLCQRRTCQCQGNSTGLRSSSIEDTFWIKIYTGRQSWLGYGGCSFVPIDM